MLYTLLAFVFAIVAVLIIHSAINMLLATSWFMGWLRGMFGMSLIAVAVIAGLLAYDIYTYKPILADQRVATVSFEMVEPQFFTAVVISRNGQEQHFKLRGDQWQLDARVIKWEGLLAALDLRPAYRLDRLSSRFYDIQKETSESRTTYPIVSSIWAIDLWQFIHKHDRLFSILDTHSGAPAYMPMKNGALYEISLSGKGVAITRPLNDEAEKAVAEWH